MWKRGIGSARQVRPHMAALALGILLIMLGHDATMAANPHATSETSHAQPMASTCGPTHGAKSPTSEMTQDDAPYSMPFLVSLPTIDLSLATPDWWSEPTYPPDVQRALLQVFLN